MENGEHTYGKDKIDDDKTKKALKRTRESYTLACSPFILLLIFIYLVAFASIIIFILVHTLPQISTYVFIEKIVWSCGHFH